MTAAVLVFSLLLGSSAIAMELRPVLNSQVDETWPGRFNGLLVWSQNSAEDQTGWHSYLRLNGERTRLNAKGSRSASVDIFRKRIVYQQWNDDGSDLFMQRGAMGERTKAASRRRAWEWQVRTSGPFLLFLRGRPNRVEEDFWHPYPRHKLVLHDLRSKTETILDSRGFRRISVGDVTGQWVVWAAYTKGDGWSVFRYSIKSGSTIEIDFSRGSSNYSPTVTPKGAVFFSNATTPRVEWRKFYNFCGEPRLVKRSPSGSFSIIHRFRRGVDAEVIFEEGREGTHFLIERQKCRTGEEWHQDIYSGAL